MVPVKLKDVVSEIELHADDSENNWRAWFDKRDGKFYSFETRHLAIAEDDYIGEPHLAKWELEIIEDAKAFNERWDSDFLVELPDKYEINEYDIMEEYCESQPDVIADQLFEAIRGRGAFRFFRSTVQRLRLTDDWYKFRDNAMIEKARRWCELNEIEYIK